MGMICARAMPLPKQKQNVAGKQITSEHKSPKSRERVRTNLDCEFAEEIRGAMACHPKPRRGLGVAEREGFEPIALA
jgi:hypothetical protein